MVRRNSSQRLRFLALQVSRSQFCKGWIEEMGKCTFLTLRTAGIAVTWIAFSLPCSSQYQWFTNRKSSERLSVFETVSQSGERFSFRIDSVRCGIYVSTFTMLAYTTQVQRFFLFPAFSDSLFPALFYTCRFTRWSDISAKTDAAAEVMCISCTRTRILTCEHADRIP